MYATRQKVGLFLGPTLFFLILLLPTPQTLSTEGFRVLAIAVLMSTWWVTEAIPIPATSLLPLALFPTLSVMSAKAASAPYANHLIYLFLGGFFIARAMEKWNLHKRIALHTIRIVGTSPNRIILGFMLSTAFLSMWISNTATAMMMVPIALAVIGETALVIQRKQDLHPNDPEVMNIDSRPTHFRFGSCLMLSIAYSASIGGAATLIGSPPNTILVGIVEKTWGIQITFAQWMALGVPLSMTMLIVCWYYLTRFAFKSEITELPGGKKLILGQLEELGPITQPEKKVLFVFAFVAACWIGKGFVNIAALAMVHDATIAIIGALILFSFPVDLSKGEFLLDWDTAQKVPWDVIILFGGGLSLAHGFNVTGLAHWIGDQLSILKGANLLVLVFAVVFLTIFLTEVTSNTATASMLIPIMGSTAVAMMVHPFALIMGAGIAASYAFMLPIATPPNAVIFGARQVTIPQMAKTGFLLNIIGGLLITFFVFSLLPLIWGVDLYTIPAWAK